MPSDWMIEIATVPYRVHCVIFFLPRSPSLESFSKYGHTTVRSCRMIDAEMYGMIPRAKIVMRPSAPPENRFRKPRIVPLAWFVNSAIATGSTPGVGMNAPRRYTASNKNVKMTRLRRSGIEKMFRRLSIIARSPRSCHRPPG